MQVINNKWLNAGCLRSLIEGLLARGEENLLVKDTVLDGGWDLSYLSFDLPLDIKNAILSTPFHRFLDREDQRSWNSSLNGNFDPKNAYLLAVGEKGTPDFKGK